ncbi:hypothetical protein [Bacillus sp. FJAT-29814]|uniref:hypothetical protein n=1 Tax=Bacillus sp. FJAT-29814 TaxID=1729688 RepID=UPI000834FCB5|nr:hypothetical protein [Bacillus sp. FJAT-29814]
MKKLIKGLAIFILIASLAACTNQKDVSTKSEETKQKEENTSVQEKTETTKNNETANTETSVEMKKVGEEEYGYVHVPNDWVKFVDVNPNTSYQVSSTDTKKIISINVFEDAGQDANLETYATIVWTNMEKNGGKDIQGAKVKLGDYDALQVYGVYNNGTMFLVTWVFQAEDGKYRYVSAEGPKEGITDVVGYVEKGGWSLN